MRKRSPWWSIEYSMSWRLASTRRGCASGSGERLKLEREDLRQKVRERKIGNLIVFVVDASASMDAEQRMAATKGAILSLPATWPF
jgi:magnesium chelatase subunit D